VIRRSRPGSALAHAAREPGPALSSQEPCQQRSWAVAGRPRDAPGSSLKKIAMTGLTIDMHECPVSARPAVAANSRDRLLFDRRAGAQSLPAGTGLHALTADLGTRHVDLPEGAFLGPKTNEAEGDRSDYSQGMRFLAHALLVDRSATATQLLT